MANEQATEELDLGEEKPNTTKLILIIVIVAVVLIGGGIAAYLLLSGNGVAEEDPAITEETAEPEVEQGPVQYLDLAPPFVVNLPGRPSLLQVGVSVRVTSESLAEFIEHNDPMIRHNLLNLLSTANAKSLRTRSSKEALQAKMLQELNGVVKELQGPGEADALYFTSFVMQ
ncbi:MAG: flagellar basal body-associated FliL family protein [Candidatus Thiodiazotropha sp. (ex Epidulcina cf. delphinae)]|nr:flagellar basal body-associated FliL family protein [Candidatus Thiodiazotropha sp. (ex Epidulcina cf. delphinae)]